MPLIRKSRGNNDEEVDGDRSIVQWRKFTAEVLKLKWNQLGLIATGKKEILCTRLFNHYQRVENVSETQSEGESVLMLDSLVTRDANENNMLMLAEIWALGSELGAVKDKQIEFERSTSMHFEVNDDVRQQQQHSTESSFVQPAARIHQGSAHRRSADRVQQQTGEMEMETKQVVGGFSMPPFVQEIRRSAPGMDNLMGTLPNEATVNPFIPPLLKDTILKRPSQMKELSQMEELLLLEGDSGVARRPAPKEVVDLNSWMVAWNSFVQACLHFKPHMFHLLLSYQRIFCRFASTYKFDCDKDVRMLIASQTSLLPAHRTVAWDEIHNESMSMYMKNNVSRTSGPVCYSCKVPGHYTSTCRQKNNRGQQRE